MAIAEFLAWADRQPDRYELIRGEAVAMGRETLEHTRVKRAVADALTKGARQAGLPCESFIDGPGVAVENDSCYVPDVILHCGSRLSPGLTLVPDPIILVEVVSSSTERYDLSVKLLDYFSIPSVQNYLVVDIKRRVVLAHTRGEGLSIPTVIVRSGMLDLDPPGLSVSLDDLFSAPDNAS